MKTFAKKVPSLPRADYRASFRQGAAYAAGMIAVNLLANAISSVLNRQKEIRENNEEQELANTTPATGKIASHHLGKGLESLFDGI